MKNDQPLATPEACNGKLFLNIGLMGNPSMGYHTYGDYYTVADGVVYLVNRGTFQRTTDMLIQLVIDCKCVGEFDPGAHYEPRSRYLSFAKAKRMLGL